MHVCIKAQLVLGQVWVSPTLVNDFVGEIMQNKNWQRGCGLKIPYKFNKITEESQCRLQMTCHVIVMDREERLRRLKEQYSRQCHIWYIHFLYTTLARTVTMVTILIILCIILFKISCNFPELYSMFHALFLRFFPRYSIVKTNQ